MPKQPFTRYRLRIKGIVQGVGFRPFVYRLAKKYELAGFVLNDVKGVLIEAEGNKAALNGFMRELKNSPPNAAEIDEIKKTEKIDIKVKSLG